MRTHARRFRSIFHRHPALPPRPGLPPEHEPVVLCAPREGAPGAPGLRVKAWLRFGAHSLLAVFWVALPQVVGSRPRDGGEPLVVEVERPCHCGRAAPAGPSLRETLAPKDDAALDRDEGDAFVAAPAPRPRAPAAPRGACE